MGSARQMEYICLEPLLFQMLTVEYAFEIPWADAGIKKVVNSEE